MGIKYKYYTGSSALIPKIFWTYDIMTEEEFEMERQRQIMKNKFTFFTFPVWDKYMMKVEV